MSLVRKIQSFVDFANNPSVNAESAVEQVNQDINYFIVSNVIEKHVRVPLVSSRYLHRGFSNSDAVATPILNSSSYRVIHRNTLDITTLKVFFGFDDNFNYSSHVRLCFEEASPYRYYFYKGMIIRYDSTIDEFTLVLLLYRLVKDTGHLTSHLGLYINKDLIDRLRNLEFVEALNKKIINKIFSLNKKGSIRLDEIITTPELLGTSIENLSLETMRIDRSATIQNCDFNFRDRLKEIYKSNE